APPATLGEAIAAGPAGRAASVELAGRTYALVTSDLAGGGANSRLAALIDIDAELKATEAATLRDLVQVLSHEVVNALTPIASLSRTAADMVDDAEPDLVAVRDAVGTIARRAAGLQRFGEAYRALARLPAPVPGRVDAAEFVADLVRLFAIRWPGVTLTAQSDRLSAAMRGDADQLTAAVWALLQNAAEAVADAPTPQVRLSIVATADETIMEVADNGCGVDDAEAEAIFRPFFTTKPAGSGVGLALARQILRAHGGDLTLGQTYLGGAAFLARLPGD
ncbi:sensor histidine kinase, partial [Sphingomonas bacterium]|uniref:sensor histidine kinase n=1 Tax=Sphingomonas bacterium TaxID=1895847 RepID=UPI001576723E